VTFRAGETAASERPAFGPDAAGRILPMHSEKFQAKLPVWVACAAVAAGTIWYPASLNAAGDAAKGKAVFEQCSICHNADSDEKKMGPGLKGLFKKDQLSNGKKPTEANVRAQINDGGNGMPAYKDMLSDAEKDDLIAYLKTL
jgi:cytochrome c2